MVIKKILIAPVETIIEGGKELEPASFFLDAAKYLKRRLGAKLTVYDGELQFYADMPRILGRENVFVFGKYYPHFHSQTVPGNCPYPSCHGTPEPTYIREENLQNTVRNVDAVLVSTRAGRRGSLVIQAAQARNIPVVRFDFKDHASNYGTADILKDLCYGLVRGRDYDLYFKKDLPLAYRTDYILPIAPIPVRPESYQFTALIKDIDIFYSGRPRPKNQADRAEAVALVKGNFDNISILEHDSRGTFMTTREYWNYLSRSRMALSPSGIVWDSFRNCEVGLAAGTALIAPRPYVETVGPPLQDGINAILYDTEFREGKYHLIRPADLVDKIRYYLGNQSAREKIANCWAEDVSSGHTVLARSRYILEQMERAL